MVKQAVTINSMKNIFKISALAVLAVGLLASCEKKEIAAPEVAVGEVHTFTLTFAQPDTKVAISDAGKTTWEAGDEILIHGEGGSNKTIVTLKAEDISADGKEAKISFSGVNPYDRFSDRGYTSVYYAQYPASASAAADYNYYYYAAFANTNAPLMAAYNVGSAFVFHNLCGVISFKVEGDYDSYTFEGNNGETVGYTLMRSRLAAQGEKKPVLQYNYSTDGAKTSIDGTITPGKTAYIGLPLGADLTKGFTITLKKDGAVAGVAKTSTAVNVERGKLLPLGDITSKVAGVYAFDYTPSEAYLASTNLWKAVFDANGEEVCGNIAGYEVKGIADVPAIVKNQSTYKMHFNGATSGDWANCNFLAPKPENPIALAAGKQYNFSFTVASNKALPRMFLKMTTYDASKTANHEGGYVWETTKALEAETPITVTDVINGVACDNISFTLDFGGNPEDVDIYIKDIVIEEVVVPAKFQWREDSVAEQTAAYNTPGAAHWYIDADADVEWNAVVKLDGVETTEAVTVEHFDVGGGHIAINYATNETLADKVWEITVTTEANVENKTLTAKLTQGAYEYTDLAKLNADIIAAGDTEVERIVDLSAGVEITKISGKNVFAQNATGGVLLYGTGLESKGMDPNGGNGITGKFVVKTKAFKGLPEITAVVSQSEDAKIGAWSGNYPCFNRTIAQIEANYPMFVNAKCKISNVEVTKAFGATKAGEIKDATGTIAIYNYSTDLTTDIPVGAKAEYAIVWPTIYNDHQLGFYKASQFKLTSSPSVITMPATKTIGVGDTFDLAATTNSTATITYVSSNTDVATVSEAGVVTAKAAGEATITASVAKAGIYAAAEATCVVTVSAGPVVDPYSIDLTYALGANAYDDNVATINGTANVKVIKIGTSSKSGSFTVTIPAGTKKITYYAVGWTGKTPTLDFQIGGSSVATQTIAGNTGATGSSPFTLTVTDSDKYEIVNDFAAETVVTVTTKTNLRAILFGIKAE